MKKWSKVSFIRKNTILTDRGYFSITLCLDSIKDRPYATIKGHGKVRKLNYIVHNPNTVEETAKVLLGIFVQANEGKVERKLRELAEYIEGRNVLNEKNAEVAGCV